jgi:hypothetical protein
MAGCTAGRRTGCCRTRRTPPDRGPPVKLTRSNPFRNADLALVADRDICLVRTSGPGTCVRFRTQAAGRPGVADEGERRRFGPTARWTRDATCAWPPRRASCTRVLGGAPSRAPDRASCVHACGVATLMIRRKRDVGGRTLSDASFEVQHGEPWVRDLRLERCTFDSCSARGGLAERVDLIECSTSRSPGRSGASSGTRHTTQRTTARSTS